MQIRRTGDGPRVRLSPDEIQLLGKLADEVDQLLADGEGAAEGADGEGAANGADGEGADGAAASSGGAQTLEELTGLDWPAAEAVDAPADPALRRLLPDAYRDDEEAAAEFRRFTDATLRGGKRADAAVVRQCLASIAVKGELVLDENQTQAWLRFVTDTRLVLASRLDIETADDIDALDGLGPDDPRALAYAVFEWLVSVLGGLLAAAPH